METSGRLATAEPHRFRRAAARMSREEIGSYLGLKLETVSRLFSRFQREALLQVQGRLVKLLDLIALRELLASAS